MRISIGKEVQGPRVALSLSLAFDLGAQLSDEDAGRLVEMVRAQLAAAVGDQVEKAAALLAKVDPALHEAVRERAVEKVQEAVEAEAAEAEKAKKRAAKVAEDAADDGEASTDEVEP